MKLVPRFTGALFLLALSCVLPATAEEMKGAQERTFPFPPAAIKAALTNLGAYQGTRLPTMEGFVNTEGIRVEDLQRPYSEFKIELVPEAPTRTRVRVKANVSAWYASPDPNYTGYRALDSNGRLESDLLDRLGEYLKDKSSDPKVLSQRIAELRAEHEAAERHVSQLQQELEKVKKASTQSSGSEFVSVARPHLSILSSPSENAAGSRTPNEPQTSSRSWSSVGNGYESSWRMAVPAGSSVRRCSQAEWQRQTRPRQRPRPLLPLLVLP